MRAIDRWRRLTANEKILVVRAAATVAAMSIGVRTVGLKRMLRAAEDAKPTAEGAPDYAAVVKAVERVGRYVPGGTCLAQSLALTWMLRTRGIAAHVRVGVQMARGFHAHAWVEVNGVAVTSESGHTALTHST
jgi:hypothetical protein